MSTQTKNVYLAYGHTSGSNVLIEQEKFIVKINGCKLFMVSEHSFTFASVFTFKLIISSSYVH